MNSNDAVLGGVPSASLVEEPTPVTAPTVGIFDSGIGGFTVARALLNLRPDLNLVYFGDTLNMPYGGRQPQQLARFAHNSIEFLISQGIDILAVGCNASNSVLGQGELKSFGIPVHDLVSSTIEMLRELEELPSPLALVATEATINSGYWQRKLGDTLPKLEQIPIAAPEFVPLAEATDLNQTVIRTAVRRHLEPVITDGVSWILHGCTHFPLLQHWMEELSPGLRFIDPAECLAQRLVRTLAPPALGAEPGRLELYSSRPNEAFYRTAERVFGRSARELTRMYIVNPHEE